MIDRLKGKVEVGCIKTFRILSIEKGEVKTHQIKVGEKFIASKWISLKDELAAVYKIIIEDKEIKVIMAYRNGTYEMDDNFKLLEDIFIKE